MLIGLYAIILQRIHPKLLLENALSIEAISELLQAVKPFSTQSLTVSASTLVEMLLVLSEIWFTLPGTSMVTAAYHLEHP